MNKRAVAVLGILALLVLPSCSSSGGSVSQETQIEEDVEALLDFLAFAFVELDPFDEPSPAVPPPGPVGCMPVTLPSGAECSTGEINECPPQKNGDIDIDFVDCQIELSAPTISVSILVFGTATYSPPDKGEIPNWPDGSRTIEIETTDGEHRTYEVTLSGTKDVLIEVMDLITGTVAECTGDLETETADCALVEAPVN